MRTARSSAANEVKVGPASDGPADVPRLEQLVMRAAEAALAERRFVTAIDVLVGIGWLAAPRVEEWRQGRVDCREGVTQANLAKLSSAMRVFRGWATRRGLVPSGTAYVARTRDRRPLRFSVSGNPDIERAYRTHWVSPALSEAKRRQLAERQSRPDDLVVVSPLKEWTCSRTRPRPAGHCTGSSGCRAASAHAVRRVAHDWDAAHRGPGSGSRRRAEDPR